MTQDEMAHLLMWAYRQGFNDAIEVIEVATEAARLGLEKNSTDMQAKIRDAIENPK